MVDAALRRPAVREVGRRQAEVVEERRVVGAGAQGADRERGVGGRVARALAALMVAPRVEHAPAAGGPGLGHVAGQLGEEPLQGVRPRDADPPLLVGVGVVIGDGFGAIVDRDPIRLPLRNKCAATGVDHREDARRAAEGGRGKTIQAESKSPA